MTKVHQPANFKPKVRDAREIDLFLPRTMPGVMSRISAAPPDPWPLPWAVTRLLENLCGIHFPGQEGFQDHQRTGTGNLCTDPALSGNFLFFGNGWCADVVTDAQTPWSGADVSGIFIAFGRKPTGKGATGAGMADFGRGMPGHRVPGRVVGFSFRFAWGGQGQVRRLRENTPSSPVICRGFFSPLHAKWCRNLSKCSDTNSLEPMMPASVKYRVLHLRRSARVMR